MPTKFGGIEAGGTSFAVSLALGKADNVVKQISITTTTPEETISQAAKQLAEWEVDAIGIGSFGPIDMNPSSPTFGFITSTPKPNWQNVNLVGLVREYFSQQGRGEIPICFNTDVNAAALAEIRYGSHFSTNTAGSLCYVTVGTGIGVGIYVEGTPVRGMLHPEAGHIFIRKDPRDTYSGNCPFHGDCLEGLSNAKAIADRFNVDPAQLHLYSSQVTQDSAHHELWDITAYYLAQLCVSLALISSPKIIVLGGGVLKNEALFPAIRAHFFKLMNGYIQAPEVESLESLQKYIIPSKFNSYGSITTSGAVGALCLAEDVFSSN